MLCVHLRRLPDTPSGLSGGRRGRGWASGELSPAPPSLSSAGGVAFGPSPRPHCGAGGGLRVGPLGGPAPSLPLGKDARGTSSQSVPACPATPRPRAPTIPQHGRQEDCPFRRHRQHRAHHASAGGASRHELGRAGNVAGCTAGTLGIVGLGPGRLEPSCLSVRGPRGQSWWPRGQKWGTL